VPRFQIARLTSLPGYANEVSSTLTRACIMITHRGVTVGFLSGVRIDFARRFVRITSLLCRCVYFRINNDFSFDDAAATHFNCTVRSFDPRSDQLHFWAYLIL